MQGGARNPPGAYWVVRGADCSGNAADGRSDRLGVDGEERYGQDWPLRPRFAIRTPQRDGQHVVHGFGEHELQPCLTWGHARGPSLRWDDHGLHARPLGCQSS
jgi:hypothetical protein